MTNADKFKGIFGIYVTELWSKPYKEFSEWLNEDVPDTNVGDLIRRRNAIDAMCSACGYDCDKSEFVYDAPIEEQVIICPEHYALSTLPSAQPEAMYYPQVNGITPSVIEPSAHPEPLTDKEQRIFLAAMGREEKVCKQVDDECRDCREPYEDSLVRTCHEIIRKVKGALWDGK